MYINVYKCISVTYGPYLVKCISSVACGYNDKQHLQCWITTSNPKNGMGMENEVGTPSRLRRYFQWLTFQQLDLVWHVFSYKWCSGPGLIWSSDRACHCPQWGPRGAGHPQKLYHKELHIKAILQAFMGKEQKALTCCWIWGSRMHDEHSNVRMCLRPGNFCCFLETHKLFWNSLGVYCAFWTPTGFWKTVGPVGETKIN